MTQSLPRLKMPLLAALLLTIAAAPLAGAPFPLESVPPWHWMNESALLLADAGVLDLDPSTRPYIRGELAAALAAADTAGIPDYLQGHLERLRRELEPETASPKAVGDRWSWRLGAHGEGFSAAGSDGLETDGRTVSRVGVAPTGGIYVYNSNRMDTFLADDTTYTGKVWRGLAGYTEQAYIAFRKGAFSGWVGRDWLRFGPGRRGTLLLGDASRPFTGIHLAADLAPLTYSWGAFELDSWNDLRRYMSVHRLQWRAADNLRVAVSEMMLYAGQGRAWELRLMNPAALWQFEQYSGQRGNALFSLDLFWKPRPKLALGLELLLDDFQLERKSSKDLEPPEIGGMATLVAVDPAGLVGSRWLCEVTAVTQRTYKTLHNGEKGLHFGKPVGWRGGNDVIDWFFRWELRPDAALTFAADLEYELKGEDRIAAPFDTTFRSRTVQEGYREPFPTGTVQRTLRFGAEGEYRRDEHLAAALRLENVRIENYDHTGWSDSDLRVSLKFELDLDVSGSVRRAGH